MSETTLGTYRILAPLGKGGMAEVLLAERTGPEGLNKKLVLKRILPELRKDPELIKLFLREASIALDLQHPNLVQVYGFEKIEDDYVLVMEYIDGLALDKLHGNLPLNIVASIGRQALQGLIFLHEQKGGPIFHRDISPQNILIDNNGFVKLVDFGIAKAEDSLADSGKTALRGTWRYAPPERKAGMAYGPGGDIFSLGLVLIEAAGARRDAPIETEGQIKGWLDTLHTGEAKKFAMMIGNWLDHDPGKRPASAKEALGKLEPFCGRIEFRDREQLAEAVSAAMTKEVGEPDRVTAPLPSDASSVRKAWKRQVKPLFLILTFSLILAVTLLVAALLPTYENGKVAPSAVAPETKDAASTVALVPIGARTKREVLVDGRPAGKTPLRLRLSPGRHEFRFPPTKKGGESKDLTIFVQPGPNREVYLKN